MKSLKYLLLSGLLAFGMTSCEDYLDVNTDPDNPTSDTATPEVRLTWIQDFFEYAYASAGQRCSQITGILTQTSTTSANGLMSKWDPDTRSGTTPYQNWYIGAAVNIDPLIKAAEAVGANHYIGCAYTIKALGFMMMLDLFGETPYVDAFTGQYDPDYDSGKEIYHFCMADLDKALEYFAMPNSTYPLIEGDTWLNGDETKWVKFVHGLKARFMLKLSKKAEFNPQGILDELSKALQSNDDNVSKPGFNTEGSETNFTVGDPYQHSHLHNCLSYGSSQRLTRRFVDMLDGDPRKSKLVPAVMTNVKLDADGNIASYKWTRDIGVDMLSENNIRLKGNIVNATFATKEVKQKYEIEDAAARAKFVADAKATNHAVAEEGNFVTVTYAPGQIYCATTDYNHAGDTAYVNMRSGDLSGNLRGRAEYDMFDYALSGYDYVMGTGTFYGRPSADYDVMTYAEMCFIKAEVLFRQGDSNGALKAYQDGIKANIDRMQDKLEKWAAAGTSVSRYVKENPDMLPMDETEIAEFLASDKICQTASDLTMAEIMKQKSIAMPFNIETWSDMRRFNYSAGNIGNFGIVYPDFDRPSEFTATSKMTGTSKNDLNYWYRRWYVSTHESNYNLTKLKAANQYYDFLGTEEANKVNPIYSCPVWWDCATDDEYYKAIGRTEENFVD
ncbi:MAG: SusD/RagB family nutrient-binding outer membrane lipoprotein [Mediterranea massiliensis]|nr:SusD/RagB family nutrient-binding outer membrane lipoprotein [Mediterranea massiliensis]